MKPGSNKPSNPYPGLRPFESDEDYLFFGREGQADDLLRRLRKFRFAAVVGSSGCGKSSLVKAGLIPALHGGGMAGPGRSWRTVLFRAGCNPLRQAAMALNHSDVLGDRDASEDDEAIRIAITEAALRRSSRGLVEVVRQARFPRDENLLLVVDQFEELFRFKELIREVKGKDEAAALVKLLLEASRSEPPSIYILITMRSDFFGECSQFRGLPEAINTCQYLLPRMTRDEIRQAIEGPAAVRRIQMAPRLVQRLLNDVGDNPDQLPILQHVLMRVWSNWSKNGAEGPDLAHYEAVGEMEKALSQHADEVYKDLPNERSRVIARRFFKCITEMGPGNLGMRRPMPVYEIAPVVEAGEDELFRVVEAFRQPGRSFLSPPPGVELSSNTVVDISHESLMRIWDRLKSWVDDEAQAARGYRRIAETAELHQKNEAGLLRDPALQLALDFRSQKQPNEAWARRYHPGFKSAMHFLEESAKVREAEMAEKEEERRRETEREKAVALAEEQKKRIALQKAAAQRLKTKNKALLVCLIIAAGLVFCAFYFFQKSERKKDELHSKKLALNAQMELEKDVVLSFRLAEKAMELKETDEAKQAVISTLERPFYNVLKRHGGQVYSAVFSPDGKYIATASEDNTAMIWDAETSKHLFTYEGHGDEVTCVAFSPDGNFLATSSFDKTARIWSVIDHKELHVLKGHTDTVNTVDFSPDGKLVATASQDKTVCIWDVNSGEIIHAFSQHSGEVASAKFSPDGKLIVAASYDDTARIFDVEKKEELYVLKGHGDDVNTAVFSEDGRSIVTSSKDKTARIWSTHDGKEVHRLTEHGGNVVDAVFSRNGKYVGTASYDKKERIWNAKNGKVEHKLVGHEKEVSKVAFSPDSKCIATGSWDNTVRIWRLNGGELIHVLEMHAKSINGVVYSGDGKRVLTASDDETALIWHIKQPPVFYIDDIVERMTFSPDLGDKVERMAFSPDSDELVERMAFSPDGKYSVAIFGNGTFRIWDIRKGEPLVGIYRDGNERGFTFMALSPDEKFLALSTTMNTVRIVNLSDSDDIKEFLIHNDDITDVAYSKHGERIATASKDNTACIWDIQGGEKPRLLKGHSDEVVSVAFSPDGKRIMTIAMNDDIRIWDAQNVNNNESVKLVLPEKKPKKKEGALAASKSPGGHSENNDSNDTSTYEYNNSVNPIIAEFSPDGWDIAVAAPGSNELWIYGAADGKLRQILKYDEAPVEFVSFSPDSAHVAIAASGAPAHVWSVQNWNRKLNPNRDEKKREIAIFLDNNSVMSICEDGSVLSRDLNTRETFKLEVYEGEVKNAAFSSDGKRIVLATGEDEIRIFTIDPKEAIREINENKLRGEVRELTEEEKKAFGIDVEK